MNAVNVVRSKPPVYTMMLFAGFVMAIAVSFSILAQPYLRSHGIGIDIIGFLQVPGQLVGIFAALFAYRLVGIIGVGRTMLLLPVVVLVAAIGLGSFDHIAAFAFYPLTGLVFAMSFPVLSTYFNDRIPSASRATVLSIYQLTFSLFVAFFEPVLGWLADTRDFPTAYLVAAVILAVGTPVLYIFWLRASSKEVLLEQEV
jgi:MFS family permease